MQKSTVYCTTSLNYKGLSDNEPTTVTINNGRYALDTLDFEHCGFTLLEHNSGVADWHNEQLVNEIHVPEIEKLATEFTGCDHAIAFPALIRSPATAKEIADYAPIESVHSDYTEDYQSMVTNPSHSYFKFLEPLLIRDGLDYKVIQEARRIMVIQFWRNIGETLPDFPLAICDAETVNRSELIVVEVPVYGGRRLDFEAFSVRTPPQPAVHVWYTFPRLKSNEVLTFRTFDSRCVEEGRPFWTPHTAFRDPNAGPDAPQRESIEMRALCLFN
ncbi:MAG: hypothetical protein IIB71_13055 [Proteobacteria bacterium]|nr:hypothetical protein [Pseudomonadota bacterium]